MKISRRSLMIAATFIFTAGAFAGRAISSDKPLLGNIIAWCWLLVLTGTSIHSDMVHAEDADEAHG